MQSLTTPISPTICGTAINGTDAPYRKVIFEMDVLATTDKISVTLYLGCYEDDDWTDEESFEINHDAFQTFMESGLRLYADNTKTYVDAKGDLVESGRARKLSYTKYVTEYLSNDDVIAYLKRSTLIPDYIIDKNL